MKRNQPAPHITYSGSAERADLPWITSMLLRWWLAGPSEPDPDCPRLAATGTPDECRDGTSPSPSAQSSFPARGHHVY